VITLSADLLRYVSAMLAVGTLLALVVALVAYSDDLPRRWRAVLWAVAGQQVVLTYFTTSRARRTPPGFPERAPDGPLLALLVSGIALLVAVVLVFVAERRIGPSRR
jgi:hypothetical protein